MIRSFADRSMQIRTPRLALLSAAIVVGILRPSTVHAEVMGGESIDWIVADSDLIIRGTLTTVETKRGKGQVVWETATVKVNETLKGEKVKHATFVVRHFGFEDVASALKERKTELLFFLVGSGRYLSDDRGYGVTDLALRKRWGVPSFVRLNDKPAKDVFTTGFRVLKKRDDVLTSVRNAVKAQAMHDKPKEHRVDVPFSTEVFQSLYAGSSVYLVVPADVRLEGHAQEWVKSKDILMRQQGVLALKYFQTKENIKLLKSLLDDPGFWTTSTGRGQNRKRVYGVRQSAYEILREWDVEVEKPVIEVPLN